MQTETNDFPVFNRPLPVGTSIVFRMRGLVTSETVRGRVLQSGQYVMRVISEDGLERFVFMDEVVSVVTKEDVIKPKVTINPNSLYVGAIILYRLLPAENPVNPNRLWRGRVLSLHVGMPGSLDVALVENLDIGYCAGTEFVLLSQIQSIETSAPVHSVHLLTGNGDS